MLHFKVNLVEARDNNLIFHNQNNKDLFTLLKIICDNSIDTKTRRKQIHDYETEHDIDKSVRMAIATTSKVNLKKYEEESDAAMCKLWDDIKNEGREEARKEDIRNMLMNGKKTEDISSFCGYDLSYVLEIEKDILNKDNSVATV